MSIIEANNEHSFVQNPEYLFQNAIETVITIVVDRQPLFAN
jgi:hypothetical protein